MTTLRPLRAAGTRYASVFPVPVPASTTRARPSARARSTCSAMASCDGRGSYVGKVRSSSVSSSCASDVMSLSGEGRQGDGSERQDEDDQAHDEDDAAAAGEGRLGVAHGWVVVEEHPGDEPPDGPPEEGCEDAEPEQHRRKGSADEAVYPGGGRVETVAAVELTEGKQVQRGEQKPEPARDRDRMQGQRVARRHVHHELFEEDHPQRLSQVESFAQTQEVSFAHPRHERIPQRPVTERPLLGN